MQAQLEYHRKATGILENVLPGLKAKVGENAFKSFWHIEKFLSFSIFGERSINNFPYNLIFSDESSLRPVFGCPLEDHLKAQNRSIAFVLEECLTYLHEIALEEQVSKTHSKKDTIIIHSNYKVSKSSIFCTYSTSTVGL
jgi:hypothetical protein